MILRGAAALGWEAAPTRRNATRLRRLRELSVRLPARHEAVRDPGPPRAAAARRGADRRSGPGHARPDRGRPGGRRRGRRPRRRPGHGRAGRRARRRSAPTATRRLVVRAPQVVVAARRAAVAGGPARVRARPPGDRPPPPAPSRAGRRRPLRRADRHVARHDAGGPLARVQPAGAGPERLRHRVGAGPSRPDRPRPAVGGHRRPRRPARPDPARRRR